MKRVAFRAAFAVAAALFGIATAASMPAYAQQTEKPAMSSEQKPMAEKPMAKKPMAEKSMAKKHMAKKHMARRAPSKSVMAIQEALNKHGAMLKVDGRMGPMTRAAIKKFQSANGLKATGRVDKATRAKLGA